jgi:CRP-like cAMP-binding protein
VKIDACDAVPFRAEGSNMQQAAFHAELRFSESMFSPSGLIDLLRERATGAGLWQPQRHGRGAALLRQGEPCDRVLLLTAGLAKLTYLTPSGDEWIKSFIVDQGVFGALEGGASRFGAAAIEPCIVANVPADWVQEAIAADPRLAVEAGAFNRWLVERKQQREAALLCDTAETRYRRMLASEAELLARLPQGDIARYLRVTPIAFSRIKRRVRVGAAR